MRIFICTAFGGLLLAACSEAPMPFEPEALAVPAATPAVGPRIEGDEGHGLILSWMEPRDDGAALLFSRFEDGGWSEPSTVITGREMFVNWADMPMVIPLGNDRLSAHWLEKSGDATYAYDVVFVQSLDGGRSWSEPMRPHSDGTQTEHGFVSMFGNADGTALIWLDGRKFVNEVTDDPVATGMTLRAAVIGTDGSVKEEQLIDELICDCCQTDIAVAAAGPVALYRDRSVEEIRDISVTRLVEGAWQPSTPLSNDNWQIPGCPVNGPSIAAIDDNVIAAWFTGAGGVPVLKARWSQDSGATFGETIEVMDGRTLGRVGVAQLSANDAAVSWLHGDAEGGNEVRVRKVSIDGSLGAVHTVSRGAGSFSVPQIARSGDYLVFVWTETEDFVNSLASARVLIAAL